MNVLRRLVSFINWPEDVASVSPVVLANAGFTYAGQGDKVVCPVCHIEVEGWHRDELLQPRDEHRRRSPNCSLALTCVRSEASCLPENLVAALRNLSPGNNRWQNLVNDCLTVNVATNAFREGSQPDNLVEVLQSAISRAGRQGCSGSEQAPAVSIDTTPADRSKPDFDQLRVENARLSTYHDWPTGAHVKPAELAADGWFYTGQNDRVRCAFCRGVLHQWNRGDVPSSEHRKHFPECPFVKGLEVGNVPMGSRQAAAAVPPDGDMNTAFELKSVGSIGRLNSATGRGSASTYCRRERQHRIDETTHGDPSEQSQKCSNVARAAAGEDVDSGSEDEEEQLRAENQRLTEVRRCKVCMDLDISTVFLPCGHLVTCHTCATKLRDCPVCRTYIRGTVKTFLS